MTMRFALWTAAAFVVSGVVVNAPGLAYEERMPDFGGAVDWLNSAPLTAKQLRGKVVLVNFWTYSCINSLRELPYIKAWAAKYKDAGLVVVGVHSPEFGFEREPANVKDAVADLRIAFAVPIDSNRSIWRAFRNDSWPADYFIDANGRIRYRHIGEGEYEKSERVIQSLLKENGAIGLDEGIVRLAATGAEAPPSADVRSPETYAGYARAENFVSPERVARDAARKYSLPARPALNQWALSGSWNIGAERAALGSAPGTLIFRFHSRDLHMVLGPGKNGAPIRFRVKLNGMEPGVHHGADVGPDGAGELRQPRMYQLIRQQGPIQDATFEIESTDPGVEIFSLTFG